MAPDPMAGKLVTGTVARAAVLVALAAAAPLLGWLALSTPAGFIAAVLWGVLGASLIRAWWPR